ncbi:MAG: phenylalanine--tRNA ligase subunit alpha [Patescibacteria group bacterium]|jgi:phenylalanyl-tRNA synthetase alpha chain
MIKKLQELETECLKAFSSISTSAELEASRVAYLGRKGRLADILADLPKLSNDEKRSAGQKANEVKSAIEGAFEAAVARIDSAQSAKRAEKEWLDISLPGSEPSVGHLHLTSQAIEEISDIFSRLGFVRARHPEVDWDYYAFESLNMPKDHPARDDWETFFVEGENNRVAEGEKGKIVLTPHTSNAQVREMEKGQLPIRMINIGKCYRRQSTARHLTMFHQFEGLVIDKTATVTELKGVCDYFAKAFFGEGRVTRLRPYHFRFTEPSFELDVSCAVCDGSGLVAGAKCKLCKGGWLELGGAGMVHPNVLKAGGLNPKEYQGFAFGWGVERTAMMRSGLNIDDIRIMYKNDLRFLQQF